MAIPGGLFLSEIRPFGYLGLGILSSGLAAEFQNFYFNFMIFFKANRKFMPNALQYNYTFACVSVSNLLLLKRTLVAINSRIIDSV